MLEVDVVLLSRDNRAELTYGITSETESRCSRSVISKFQITTSNYREDGVAWVSIALLTSCSSCSSEYMSLFRHPLLVDLILFLLKRSSLNVLPFLISKNCDILISRLSASKTESPLLLRVEVLWSLFHSDTTLSVIIGTS